MRNFSKAPAVALRSGGGLRLILNSPTGEQVYHDLTPAEAGALREALPAPVPPAPAVETPPKLSRKVGKEN